MESTTQFVRCWAIIAAEDTTNAEVDAMHIRNNTTNRDADFVMVGGAASRSKVPTIYYRQYIASSIAFEPESQRRVVFNPKN